MTKSRTSGSWGRTRHKNIIIKDPWSEGNPAYVVPLTMLASTLAVSTKRDPQPKASEGTSSGGRSSAEERAEEEKKQGVLIEETGRYLTEIAVRIGDSVVFTVPPSAIIGTKGYESYKRQAKRDFIRPFPLCGKFNRALGGSGHCRAGENCGSIHVDAKTLPGLDARRMITPCCWHHGDSLAAKSGLPVFVVDGHSWKIPVGRWARTAALKSPEEGPTTLMEADICLAHVKSHCPEGRSCEKYHICRVWTQKVGLLDTLTREKRSSDSSEQAVNHCKSYRPTAVRVLWKAGQNAPRTESDSSDEKLLRTCCPPHNMDANSSAPSSAGVKDSGSNEGGDSRGKEESNNASDSNSNDPLSTATTKDNGSNEGDSGNGAKEQSGSASGDSGSRGSGKSSPIQGGGTSAESSSNGNQEGSSSSKPATSTTRTGTSNVLSGNENATSSQQNVSTNDSFDGFDAKQPIVLCRHYLEGSCKLDSQCKAAHVNPDFIEACRLKHNTHGEVVLRCEDGRVFTVPYADTLPTRGLVGYKRQAKRDALQPFPLCSAGSACPAGSKCNAIHVDPQRLAAIFDRELRTPCCYHHGDSLSTSNCLVAGLAMDSHVWRFPTGRMARTAAPERPDLWVEPEDICTSHILGKCKAGRGCMKYHVCRGWMRKVRLVNKLTHTLHARRERMSTHTRAAGVRGEKAAGLDGSTAQDGYEGGTNYEMDEANDKNDTSDSSSGNGARRRPPFPTSRGSSASHTPRDEANENKTSSSDDACPTLLNSDGTRDYGSPMHCSTDPSGDGGGKNENGHKSSSDDSGRDVPKGHDMVGPDGTVPAGAATFVHTGYNFPHTMPPQGQGKSTRKGSRSHRKAAQGA